jgi:hypothetical protein
MSTRDPTMPCPRCGGRGFVGAAPYVMILAYALGLFRSLTPNGEVVCPLCGPSSHDPVS